MNSEHREPAERNQEIHPVAEAAAWDSAHAANNVYDEIKSFEQQKTEIKKLQETLGYTAAKAGLEDAYNGLSAEISIREEQFATLIDIAGVVYGKKSTDTTEAVTDAAIDDSVAQKEHVTSPEQRERALEFVNFADTLTESRETIELGDASAAYAISELRDKKDGGESLTADEEKLLQVDTELDELLTGAYYLADITTPSELSILHDRLTSTLRKLDSREGDPTLNGLEGTVLDCLDDITLSSIGVKRREKEDKKDRYGMQLATVIQKTQEARENVLASVEEGYQTGGHTKALFEQLSQDVCTRSESGYNKYAPIIDFMVARFTIDTIGVRKEEANSYNLQAFEKNYKTLSTYFDEIKLLSQSMEQDSTLRDLYPLDFIKDDRRYSHGMPQNANKNNKPIWQQLNALVHAARQRAENPERGNSGNFTGYKARPYRAVRLTRRLGHTIDIALEAKRNNASVGAEINSDEF